MKWIVTTIGEHCTVTSSKRFHLSDRSKMGIPFYCSKEIIQIVNGQEVTECDFIREEYYEEIKKKFGVPKTGDLLITTRGTYGIPYIYRDTDCFYFADGNLTWLKDFDDALLPQYLYYWVLSHEGQKKIDAIAKGTAQKAVPIATLKLLELYLPPLGTQYRITKILTVYDDLIETNQKQIKLLEEAAQRLYKEWFVDLRFPGYEKVAVVDGVPEGWERNRADSFFSISIGKTPPRAEKQWFVSGSDGVPWLSISDMGSADAFALVTNEALTEEAVNKFHVKVVPPGTVFVSFKLTVRRVAIATMDMCTNEAISHFRIKDGFMRAYTYCYLCNFEYDTFEWENRAAFVAECKVWTGPGAVEKAVNQLDGYLTWRDCKTALIYFVRNKDFMQTLEAAETALRRIEYMRSVTVVDKNEFECLFSSKSNPGQTVKMRVMLFNLYADPM